MWIAWLRAWLFMEAAPIVRAGRRRALSAADAPELAASLRPEAASRAFDHMSLAPFWPFIVRLFFSAGAASRRIVALVISRLGVTLSMPFLLHALLERLPQAQHAQRFALPSMLGLALLLGLAGLVSALLGQHLFHQILQVRTVLVNAVNRRVVAHALRLRRASRAAMETGDLVNHLGSDTDALAEAGFFITDGFSAALTIAATFIGLGVFLGWAVFAAAAALLLLVPMSALLARRFRRLDHRIMSIRDQRANLMSQLLHGIRVVKYHAWESSLEAEVRSVRRREIRTRVGVVSTDVLASAIWVSTGSVAAFAGLGCFVMLGGELSAPLLFACLSLFGMLEEPFGVISHTLAKLEHARVASTRLQQYFDAATRPQDERELSAPEQAIGVRASALVARYHGADAAALEDATLDIPPGAAVAIVGPVGAGKSTLLRLLGGIEWPSAGRVDYTFQAPGEAARPRSAYVPQEAFILNATLRENIEFGADGDSGPDRDPLASIAADCALSLDLAALPAGLQTEIGERGVNLSGGQKQRVALARAVYHRPGLVCLDDPLSAVDVHTEDALVQRLLFGRWRGVTRIMVTHRLAHLPRFDHVVFVAQGRIAAQGTHAELLQNCAAFRAFTADARPQRELLGASDAMPEDDAPRAQPGSEHGPALPSTARITEDEDRETGAVRWPVYRDYVRGMAGRHWLAAPVLRGALLLSVATVALLPLLQRGWFARVADHRIQASPLSAVAVYGLLGLVVLGGLLAQRFLWLYRAVAAGRTLHDQALAGVLGAPLRFFDATPTGRLLNRFARDLEAVDDELAWSIEQACRTLAQTLVALVLIVATVPVLLCVVVPMLGAYYRLQRDYRGAAREAKRLEAIARSPRYAHFKELVSGLDVIHGFEREPFFMARFYAILGHYQRMHWCSIKLNRWFGVRVPLLSGLLSLGTSVAIVLMAHAGAIGGGMAGLVLSYALGLWNALNWAVRALSEVESNMTSAERLQHYTRLTAEPNTTRPPLPDAEPWPTHGALAFHDLAVRYAPHLPRVLDGVSFRAPAGAKVGVVGRTGAGKSTLFQALFRFIEPERGAITIDGVDIGSVPLPRLRRALAIIPQDPTLFAGSVRKNLDRFGTCSDEQVWTALRRVHLDALIRGLPGGLEAAVAEHGHNFSQGQRQLLCMGRAILTRARIVVLDEATASVDVRTDRLIQETVRAELRDVTVLVIAHRLDTVADSDLIVELAAGRVIRQHRGRLGDRDAAPRAAVPELEEG
jgi:ABC-type multidrug transport system fused ATPase/permease subunit